jgi:hypothetical protein
LVPAKGSASTAFLVTLVQAGSAEVLIDAKGAGISAAYSTTIDVTVSKIFFTYFNRLLLYYNSSSSSSSSSAY